MLGNLASADRLHHRIDRQSDDDRQTAIPGAPKPGGSQQSAQSAQPASSSGPVYGPFSQSYAGTSTLYRGFGAITYGFVYPVPSNRNFSVNFYYYNSSTKQLVLEVSYTPTVFTSTMGSTTVFYYYEPEVFLLTTQPSGTYIVVAGNCTDPLNPTNGCEENYSTVNVA